MSRLLENALLVGQKAIFFQLDATPDEKHRFRGEVTFGGVNTPLGDVNPIYLPSTERPSDWTIIDVTQGSEGLPNTDFTARLQLPLVRYWSELKRKRCSFNAIVKQDDCGRPDDLNSWQYLILYPGMRLTDFTNATVNPLTGDDEAPDDITGSVTALDEVYIFQIRFQAVADATIDAEAIDGFYATVESCGGRCGKRTDECENLYVLTAANSGSPGLSSQVVFSLDDKETFQKVDISTLGGVSADAFADAGRYVIVVSRNDDAHHFILFDDLEAQNASAWSRLSTGYASGVGLLDVFAKSPAEIYIAGEDGYIYFLDDPTAQPEIITDGSIVTDNLRAIDGQGRLVVAAGNNGKVLVSTNNGTTFGEVPITLTDGTVITEDVTTIATISTAGWMLGTDSGNVYYTLDAGVTYREKVVDENITVVNDIRFVDNLVGYMAVQMGDGSVRVYRTFDTGATWRYQAPSITSLPDAERYSFVAPCGANEVAAGGRVSVGGDGILSIAR